MGRELDLLIENATVYDGESPAPRRWRVGVAGARIALVEEADSPAPAAAARQVIDARGLVLCPGFIDTHASTGFGYRLPHAADHKLWQGVTTEVIGNCGTSSAPIGEPLQVRTRELAEQAGFPFDWRTLDEWLRSVEAHGLPINSATYVGHGTVRVSIAGDARQVTEEDLAAMEREVEAAMRAGALGLSTGLVYAPGSFADTTEVIRLARVAARHGGRYASHIRNEREGLEAAVAEVIEISRRAELPALVSHLKAAERPNWGKIPGIIQSIERARGEGVDVTFEVYPYAAVSTQLRTFIPKQMLAGGVEAMVERLATPEWRGRAVAWLDERGTDYASMMLITESLAGSRGASVAELAVRGGEAPAETVIELLLADPGAWIVYHCIDEADLDAAVSWPDSIVCSDSWSYPVNAPHQIGDPHPRTFGAFTRFLERWALRDERMPLGAAIRKITSLPADFLGFVDRGRIRQGCMADLVLLDPGAVAERATYSEPRQVSAGMVGVWVNGTRMLGDGGLCVAKPGRILRNGHDQATNS